MGKYQAGEETRRKILEAAKTIFYQRGYEEASYTAIAGKAGVNRGLIPYHFNSKLDLALAVYDSFMEDYVRTRDEIAKDCSKEEQLVIDILYYYRLAEDDNVLRFLSFIMGEEAYRERIIWGEEIVYRRALLPEMNYTEEEWEYLICMIVGMAGETIRMMCRKKYENIRELPRTMLQLFFPALGYSVEYANKVFEAASSLLDQYEFQVTENFEIIKTVSLHGSSK